MPLSDALNMPLSFEHFYYQSSAWQARKKNIEEQQHSLVNSAQQLNQIISVLGRQR